MLYNLGMGNPASTDFITHHYNSVVFGVYLSAGRPLFVVGCFFSCRDIYDIL